MHVQNLPKVASGKRNGQDWTHDLLSHQPNAQTTTSWMEQGYMSHWTQNWSFQRRRSQPISWLAIEKTQTKQN